MSTVLKLSDAQRQSLITLHKNRLSQIEKEKLEILDLLKQIDPENADWKNVDAKPFTIAGGSSETYRVRWNWTQKVKYILKEVGHCLTTRDILDRICDIEPEVRNQHSAINSVSGTISGKSLKGIVFKRYQPYEGSENYVGLLEWWETEYDEEPKDEFKADI